jgi:hypothetical protein
MNPIEGIIDAASGLADSIFGGIDSVVTSDEERKKLKAKMQKDLLDFKEKALKFREAQLDAKKSIITSSHDQPFWKNWRGLVMIGIFILSFAHAVFPSVTYFSPESLMAILKWGLGGYIGGEMVERGIEKAGEVGKQKERRRTEEAKWKKRRQERAMAELPSTELEPAPLADVDTPDT